MAMICLLVIGKMEISHGNKFNFKFGQTMKKIFILMAAAAVMFAASCNKMEEVNTPVEPVVETEFITIDLNPMTKTSLDGKATVWTEGDEVSVTVGGENIGSLKLVKGTTSTFSGEVKAGKTGAATLNYPAGVTSVPTTQAAVAGSFANGAALLEGTTTMDALRAGEGAQLSNTTALLQFSVAQAGDVTFEVGTTKYTVTGCQTGKTYYACVAPSANVNFTARIGGYLSRKASKNVTFAANTISNLDALPAPEVCEWGLVGAHQGWNLSEANLTKLYKEGDNLYVVKNITLQASGFKFTELKNTNWNLTFGSHSGSYKYNVNDGWYAGIYTNNRGDKESDIQVSDWTKSYDVYLRYMRNESWGKELGFSIVETGKPHPAL